MNFKALVKTFTPSKTGILMVLAILAALTVLVGISFALAIGLNYLLVFAFGEKIAGMIFTGLVVAVWSWWLIGEPLYDRYKRIKRESEG